jgi:hypothetical protein
MRQEAQEPAPYFKPKVGCERGVEKTSDNEEQN